MQDPFLRSQQPLPVESAVAVTVGQAFTAPNGNPNKATRAILVGGAGTLTVTMADGTSVALHACHAHVWLLQLLMGRSP